MENNTNRPENIINLDDYRVRELDGGILDIFEEFLRLDEPVRESKPIPPDLRTPEEKAAARTRIAQEFRETIMPQYRLLTEGEKE